jgi:hypothetical protein
MTTRQFLKINTVTQGKFMPHKELRGPLHHMSLQGHNDTLKWRVINIFNFHSELHIRINSHLPLSVSVNSTTRVNKPPVTASKSDLHSRQLHTLHSAVTALVYAMHVTRIPAVTRPYSIAFGWMVTHKSFSRSRPRVQCFFSFIRTLPGALKLLCVFLKYSTIQD